MNLAELHRLRQSIIPEAPKIDPPRSWPMQWKLRFVLLPEDLQAFISEHEAKRDKEVRRCHSALDRANKHAEKLEQELAKTQSAAA